MAKFMPVELLPFASRAFPLQDPRRQWNIPDEADLETAYWTGEEWALAYLDFRCHADTQFWLPMIMHAMERRHRSLAADSGAVGYAMGFLAVLEDLAKAALIGAGGPELYRKQVLDARRDAVKQARALLQRSAAGPRR